MFKGEGVPATAEPRQVHHGFGYVAAALVGGLAAGVFGGEGLGDVVPSPVAQVGLVGVGDPGPQVGLGGGDLNLNRLYSHEFTEQTTQASLNRKLLCKSKR